jgi:N utilization substance protein B
MSSSRHLAREVALQILYRYDAAQQGGQRIPSSPIEIAQDLAKHFEHFQVTAGVREFTSTLVAGTLLHQAKLNSVIEKHASHWKVARMALIDRNLLRMAAFELLNSDETPTRVILDEAIELAKQFGTSDSSAFINGVLDSLQKERGQTTL